MKMKTEKIELLTYQRTHYKKYDFKGNIFVMIK